MNETKLHITRIVERYIKQFPEEYALVIEAITMKRSMSRNQYANLEGSKDTRALFEISETLSTMFVMDLSEEETVWFKTKQGAHWFAKKFKVFTLPELI
jgi:hypothetical protein